MVTTWEAENDEPRKDKEHERTGAYDNAVVSIRCVKRTNTMFAKRSAGKRYSRWVRRMHCKVVKEGG